MSFVETDTFYKKPELSNSYAIRNFTLLLTQLLKYEVWQTRISHQVCTLFNIVFEQHFYLA